jgi:rhodanese-related sulfurtransferase
MTVEELNQNRERRHSCVLDVREAWELVPPATRSTSSTSRWARSKSALELPKDHEIVCACRSGGRSAQVVAP